MKSLCKLFIGTGVLLLCLSILLALYNLWDTRRAEMASLHVLEQMMTSEEETPEEELPEVLPESSAELENGPSEDIEIEIEELPLYRLNPQISMPVEIIDGRAYIGTLEIPALSLTLPVLSEWSYPNLKIAPCRYTGSAYLENMVIAAHNYQVHFGQLKYLHSGDEVIFTDADGNVFSYTVQVIEVLQPTDIEEMTETDWALTLFTCTIGGKTRVTVRCA